jgi:hypothetical protein
VTGDGQFYLICKDVLKMAFLWDESQFNDNAYFWMKNACYGWISSIRDKLN